MDINPGQILSLALASVPTMLTVLMGILINNSRLSDVNARINDLRSHMDSRFDEMRAGTLNCGVLRKFSTLG